MTLPSTIEPLESRIAPAGLLTKILTFTDGTDGDSVTLLSDRPLTAAVTFTSAGNPSEIVLTGAGLDGASLTTAVTRSATGDGFVNVGRILATNLDLGVVTVKGDLGKIVCGNDTNPLPGLKALNVRSMGMLGLATQVGGDLASSIKGNLGTLNVLGDVLGGRIAVTGDIGTVKIGGDLRGNATGFSGRLIAVNAGSVSIRGDLVAGAGDESGKLNFSGNVGKLSIGGDVFGAIDATDDPLTGQILVSGNAGPVTIHGNIYGAGSEQKALDFRKNVGPITIGGSIYAASGKYSGGIYVGQNAGLIKIGGSLIANTGDFSAAIEVGGKGNGFFLGGDVRGSSGDYLSAFFSQVKYFGNVGGTVKIGGSVIGGTGVASAVLGFGTTKSFYLGGSIVGSGKKIAGVPVPLFSGGVGVDAATVFIGGDLIESAFGGGAVTAGNALKFTIGGSILGSHEVDPQITSSPQVSTGTLGILKIGGSIVGSTNPMSTGSRSSTFKVGGSVTSLSVGGSLIGGNQSGGGTIEVGGNVGSAKIAGTMLGDAGVSTAALYAGGTIGSVTVGGSVVAGAGYDTHAGQISAANIGKVRIAGDLLGQLGGIHATNVGAISIGGLSSGLISGSKVGPVKIGGDLIAPNGAFAAIQAVYIVGVSVGGDVRANSAMSGIAMNSSISGPVTIAGDLRGSDTTTVRIISRTLASLTVMGTVSNAQILGGFDLALMPALEDTSVGPVKVGRDWIASSIVSGVKAGADGKFGTGDDAPIGSTTPALSRIASITISGQVLGTSSAGDHFGFVAQSIGPLKIGGVAYTPGATPIELSGFSGDVTVRVV